MSASIKQAVAVAINSSAAQFSVTLPGVTAGNTIVVIVANGDLGTPIASLSDGTNTYTLETTLNYGPGVIYGYAFVAQNVASGSFTIVSNVSNCDYPFGIAIEIQGVTTTPLDGHTGVVQSAPGAGTNALTVGPPSPNNTHTPALVLAVAMDVTPGGSGDGNPSAGTGYTLYNVYNPWGHAGNSIAVESRLLSSGTSSAATFTVGSPGNGNYCQYELIFDQAAAAPTGNVLLDAMDA